MVVLCRGGKGHGSTAEHAPVWAARNRRAFLAAERYRHDGAQMGSIPTDQPVEEVSLMGLESDAGLAAPPLPLNGLADTPKKPPRYRTTKGSFSRIRPSRKSREKARGRGRNVSR
jgi:hypothetical protein